MAARKHAARRGRQQDQPAASQLDQVTRLHLALGDHLGTLCRIAWFVSDEEANEDELLEQVALLAHDQSEIVPPGRERAWLLRTLLGLLGARLVPGGAGAAGGETMRDLPRLSRPADPVDAEIPESAFLRLHEALRDIEKPDRASLVLVVQEGLSMAEGARIQGGSRGEFTRRVTEALAVLDDELIEALMGRVGHAPRA